MFMQNRTPSCGESLCGGHQFAKRSNMKRKSIKQKNESLQSSASNSYDSFDSLKPVNLSLRTNQIMLTLDEESNREQSCKLSKQQHKLLKQNLSELKINNSIEKQFNHYYTIRNLFKPIHNLISKTSALEDDTDNKSYLDSLTDFFWMFGDDQPASYDKIKKEKQEILKKNKEILKKELSDKDYDPDEYDEDDYELIKKKMKKIENSKSSDEKKKLIDELIQKLKSKYQSKLNKLLLQESMLCKINDQADEFDSLNNVRPKLRYGDIIEFKRLGYSHFSIYIDNNQLLQFENPLYNNITFKNVFNDFPSLL